MTIYSPTRVRWGQPHTGSRGRLNGSEFFALIFLSVFPTIILLVPGDLLRLGGRYGWWTPMAGAPPAMILAWIGGSLAGRGGDSVRGLLRSLGPVGGRVALVAMWAALGFYVAIIAREMMEASLASFVADSVPGLLVVALIVSVSSLFAWWGPVTLGRTAAVLAPILIGVVLVMIAAGLPSAHLLWVRPLLPRNTRFLRFAPLLRMWLWTAEPTFLTALLIEHADSKVRQVTGRSLAWLIATVSVLTALVTCLVTAKIGPQGATLPTLPVRDVASNFAFGAHVLSLETAIVPVVTMGAFVKLALFQWAWARLGSGLVRVRLKVALVVQSVGTGALALTISHNAVGIDRLFTPEGEFALPALVVGTLLAYTRSARRRSPGP